MKFSFQKKLFFYFLAFFSLSNLETNAQLNPGELVGIGCVFPGSTPGSISHRRIPPNGGVLPYSLVWQKKAASDINWVDLVGENNETYYPPVQTESVKYRRKVTDATLTTLYTPELEIVYVSTQMNPGTISIENNQTCYGGIPNKIETQTYASNFFEGLYYAWQDSIPGGFWTDIPGVHTTGYQPGPIYGDKYFRRVATDECSGPRRYFYSNVIHISTFSAFNAGSIFPELQYHLIGTAPTILSPLPSTHTSGGSTKYAYKWEKSLSASGPWVFIPGETNITYQPPISSDTAFYRREDRDIICGTIQYSNIAEIRAYHPLNPGDLEAQPCVYPGNIPALIESGHIGISGGVPPYTILWDSMPASSSAWNTIPGATGPTYQPPVLTETTKYRRSVFDSIGNHAFTDYITITLISNPLLGGTIGASNHSICSNTSPGLIDEITQATGNFAVILYQWQDSIPGGNWNDIIGANALDYLPGNLTQTTYFRRKATETCSNISTSAYSNIVEILVASLNPGAILNSTSVCITYGTTPGVINNVAFPSGGSGGLNYQWQININGAGWNDIVGETNPDLLNLPVINQPTSFRRKVTDNCPSVDYSNVITFTDGGVTNAGEIVAGLNICTINTNVSINNVSDATGSAYTYTWEKRIKGGNWETISGETGNNISSIYISQTTYFRRVVHSGCGSAQYSNEVVYYGLSSSINPGFILATNSFTCPGEQPGPINSAMDACAEQGTISYSWEVYDLSLTTLNPIAGVTSSNLPTPPIYNGSGAIYFRTATDVCGNAATTFFPQYILDPNIFISNPIVTPSTQTYCASLNATPKKLVMQQDCLNTMGTLSYQWQDSISGGIWNNISGAIANEYQPPILSQTRYYRLKVITSLCNKTIFSNVVVINIDAGCRIINGIYVSDTKKEKLETELRKINSQNKTEVKLNKVPIPGDLVVFPNPVNGKQITAVVQTKGKVNVTLQSVEGKVLPIKIIMQSEKMIRLQLPESVSSGTYILQVHDSSRKWVEKIVVR